MEIRERMNSGRIHARPGIGNGKLPIFGLCFSLSAEKSSHPWLTNVYPTAAAAAESLQLCPTLCDPITPPGSPVPGILQARTLEWVAISFSNAGKWKVKMKLLSRVMSNS